jgi:hypothetical protein
MQMRILELFLEQMRVLFEPQQSLGGADGVAPVGLELGQRASTLMRAGSPMSRSVGVYPTREGVSRKLASLVRIWKWSPLKAEILVVQEPRSMPQITAVDFIIFEIIMTPSVLLCLLSLLLAIGSQSAGKVELYTHRWCALCRKAKAVFDRVEKTLSPSL